MAKQSFVTGQVLTADQMLSLQQTAMGGGAATAKTANYVLVAADAGGTVAMNAAGATTITVNTGLFAAGDTVFIQNLGVGACTVTAGSATVATAGSLILPQNDAGILYFTSASAAIFYDYIQAGAVSPLTTKGDLYTFSTSDARLGVGANGTTLVADSSEATGLKWQTPAAPSFVGAKVFTTATQSISNNTGTIVNFNSEEFDTNSFHDNTTNNSRLTIPSGKDGKYAVSGQIVLGSAATGVRQQLKIMKNGTMVLISEIGGFDGSVQPSINVATILSLVATDYVELEIYQATGQGMNIPNTANSAYQFFQAQFLGA